MLNSIFLFDVGFANNLKTNSLFSFKAISNSSKDRFYVHVSLAAPCLILFLCCKHFLTCLYFFSRVRYPFLSIKMFHNFIKAKCNILDEKLAQYFLQCYCADFFSTKSASNTIKLFPIQYNPGRKILSMNWFLSKGKLLALVVQLSTAVNTIHLLHWFPPRFELIKS